MTATELVTLICPGLGLILGYYCLSEDNFDWRSAAFCFSVFIAASAFCFELYWNDDLVRYFEEAERISKMPFSEAVLRSMRSGENLWAFSSLCWVIGLTNNFHWLPAITSFAVYYVGFYVTGRIGEDLQVPKKHITVYYFFMMIAISFWGIANNIRNVFSFSLIGYAVFRDVYENKKNFLTCLFYILPVYIHPSALSIILCRVILVFTGKLKIICLALCASVRTIIVALYNISSSIPSSNGLVLQIKSAIRKAYVYFSDSGSSGFTLVVKNSGSRKLMKLLYCTMAIFMCILAYRSSKYIKTKQEISPVLRKKILFMIDFDFTVGLLVLSCIPMTAPEYWRFMALMILFAAPVFFIQEKMVEDKSIENDSVLYLGSDVMIKIIGICGFCYFLVWMRDVVMGSNWQKLLWNPYVCNPLVQFASSIFNMIFER